MFHYVYKITSPSGKYYCGRHSTDDLNDGYMGSGKWVKSIKDKTNLTKEILGYASSFEELLVLEATLINHHIGDEQCMNFHTSSCGWGSGSHNPNTIQERREANSKRMMLNNPMKGKQHTPEAKQAISEAVRGEKNPFFGKKHTDETRQKMRKPKIIKNPVEYSRLRCEISRRLTANGKKPPSFQGQSHTQTSKEKMVLSQSKVPKRICECCGKSMKPQSYSRWHGPKCKGK